jgi:hypothetical protein
MGWFRTNRTFGGRLALFALALQFWLSFAHIHPEDLYGPANVPLSSAAQIASLSTDATKFRPIERTSRLGDDICAICATIYLLNSSSAPQAPQLEPLSLSSQPAEHVIRVFRLFVSARRAPFQSRAPPAV